MNQSRLSRPLVFLGLAGWAPQAICLLMALRPGAYQDAALSAGCLYAAIILSFLGGLWWMAGLLTQEKRAWLYLLAVAPSLGGWAAVLPLAFGGIWPGPSLIALGLMLLASPLADLLIARHIVFPAGWLRLRLAMATGLGLLTLVLAAL